ncbi:MAG: hypothetical protein IJ648_09000 [Lachnospiraceae bacterium]|nr:hypothetical protein [Lachnospiraceae bacterium]
MRQRGSDHKKSNNGQGFSARKNIPASIYGPPDMIRKRQLKQTERQQYIEQLLREQEASGDAEETEDLDVVDDAKETYEQDKCNDVRSYDPLKNMEPTVYGPPNIN